MLTARTRDRFGLDGAKSKPRNDIYVGLLIVSLVAMLIGCLLLYLDMSSYPESKPPAPEVPAVKGK